MTRVTACKALSTGQELIKPVQSLLLAPTSIIPSWLCRSLPIANPFHLLGPIWAYINWRNFSIRTLLILGLTSRWPQPESYLLSLEWPLPSASTPAASAPLDRKYIEGKAHSWPFTSFPLDLTQSLWLLGFHFKSILSYWIFIASTEKAS